MQIYWNKRKRLHKKRVQLPQDWLGTPTWPPFHCFVTPIWPRWPQVKTLYWTGLFVYFLVCCLLFTLFSPSKWPLKRHRLQLELGKHTHPVELSSRTAAPGEYYPLCIQYNRSAYRVHQSADIRWRCAECYGGQFVKIHWTRDHGSSGQQQGPIKLHLCHHYSHEWRW